MSGDTLDGGAGNDALRGDDNPAATGPEALWSRLPGAPARRPVSRLHKNAGGMAITAGFDAAPNNKLIETADNTRHTMPGEPFDPTSALERRTSGLDDHATVTLDSGARVRHWAVRQGRDRPHRGK